MKSYSNELEMENYREKSELTMLRKLEKENPPSIMKGEIDVEHNFLEATVFIGGHLVGALNADAYSDQDKLTTQDKEYILDESVVQCNTKDLQEKQDTNIKRYSIGTGLDVYEEQCSVNSFALSKPKTASGWIKYEIDVEYPDLETNDYDA